MCLCVPHLNLCWLTKLQRTIPWRVKLIFLMPGFLSGEWMCVQYILSTVQVEYFSVLFGNMVKVNFYLKARSYKQYLAVAPFPSRSHSPDIGRKVNRLSHWCIQIWSLSRARHVSKNESKVPDFSQMKCEMVLYLDSGTVINRTRGPSCLLILRFDSLMYSCPFRRWNLFSLHRWTINHGSWEYRQGVFCFA